MSSFQKQIEAKNSTYVIFQCNKIGDKKTVYLCMRCSSTGQQNCKDFGWCHPEQRLPCGLAAGQMGTSQLHVKPPLHCHLPAGGLLHPTNLGGAAQTEPWQRGFQISRLWGWTQARRDTPCIVLKHRTLLFASTSEGVVILPLLCFTMCPYILDRLHIEVQSSSFLIVH